MLTTAQGSVLFRLPGTWRQKHECCCAQVFQGLAGPVERWGPHCWREIRRITQQRLREGAGRLWPVGIGRMEEAWAFSDRFDLWDSDTDFFSQALPLLFEKVTIDSQHPCDTPEQRNLSSQRPERQELMTAGSGARPSTSFSDGQLTPGLVKWQQAGLVSQWIFITLRQYSSAPYLTHVLGWVLWLLQALLFLAAEWAEEHVK